MSRNFQTVELSDKRRVHDPVTHAPTTFALRGLVLAQSAENGQVVHRQRHKGESGGGVYQLDADDQNGFLSFLKADDNILFFLDKNRELLVGNESFSYTLNRATTK